MNYSKPAHTPHFLSRSPGHLPLCIEQCHAVQIKFLTENTGGKSKANRFKRACNAFQEEHPGFEIRKGQGLHDRFILTSKQGWSVGSSLKDFGKTFSALTPLSDEVKKNTEKIFDDLWRKA